MSAGGSHYVFWSDGITSSILESRTGGQNIRFWPPALLVFRYKGKLALTFMRLSVSLLG
jgi:hypothetical protein